MKALAQYRRPKTKTGIEPRYEPLERGARPKKAPDPFFAAFFAGSGLHVFENLLVQ